MKQNKIELSGESDSVWTWSQHCRAGTKNIGSTIPEYDYLVRLPFPRTNIEIHKKFPANWGKQGPENEDQ